MMKGGRIIVGFALICIITHVQGCYSRQLIDRSELFRHPEYKIYTVVTIDGEIYEFEPAANQKEGFISGTLEDKSFVEISCSQVEMVSVRKPNNTKTFMVCCLGTTTGAVVYMIITGSWVWFFWILAPL